MFWIVVYGTFGEGIEGAAGPFGTWQEAKDYADWQYETNKGMFEFLCFELDEPDSLPQVDEDTE